MGATGKTLSWSMVASNVFSAPLDMTGARFKNIFA